MNTKDGCILIIDDIEMTVDIAKKSLEDKYGVIVALSGEEGFELLKEKAAEIDLILLDIMLPGMDGYGFMEKMKRAGFSKIPVIMMTADTDQKKEVLALKRGAADYIRKPLHPEILQTRVENVLLRYRMEYDSLTGLYNRSKTFQMIREMVQNHPGKTFSFLRFDIDNFSIYNSSMGEKEGNHLLLTGAAVLQAMPKDKEACVYGRIDADVFCLCEIYDEELVMRHINNTMKLLIIQ